MSNTSLVNIFGMLAGTIWMCAAFYFQMVTGRSIHPAYVSSLFLIGVALMMSSSALALKSPGTIETLAIAGNIIFCVLGIGVWYSLWKSQALDEDLFLNL